MLIALVVHIQCPRSRPHVNTCRHSKGCVCVFLEIFIFLLLNSIRIWYRGSVEGFSFIPLPVIRESLSLLVLDIKISDSFIKSSSSFLQTSAKDSYKILNTIWCIFIVLEKLMQYVCKDDHKRHVGQCGQKFMDLPYILMS